MAAEKTKYTEKELKEFKEIIDAKIEQARAELKELQEQITHQGKFGSDDTDYKFKGLDDGKSVVLAKENISLKWLEDRASLSTI